MQKEWNMKMKQAIVTGANGFIGKTLVRHLLEKNYFVVALDIRFDDELANSGNVRCVSVAGRETLSLKEAIGSGEYECFFHLAWAGTSGPPPRGLPHAVGQCPDVLRLCRAVQGVRVQKNDIRFFHQ